MVVFRHLAPANFGQRFRSTPRQRASAVVKPEIGGSGRVFFFSLFFSGGVLGGVFLAGRCFWGVSSFFGVFFKVFLMI